MPREDKRPEPGEDEVERLVYDAMRSSGWLPPETEEDVARAEEELAREPVPLPEDLKDPSAVIQRLTRCEPRSPLGLPSSAETEGNLARAAREGGEIPEEAEERMRADREAAEREADGKK